VKTYQTIEATGLGAAMATAIGTSIYPNLSEAITKMVHLKKIVQPSSNQKIYKKTYKKWLKVYEKLSQIKSDPF
jgi:sugar (pentulose or hexulose) kinase